MVKASSIGRSRRGSETRSGIGEAGGEAAGYVLSEVLSEGSRGADPTRSVGKSHLLSGLDPFDGDIALEIYDGGVSFSHLSDVGDLCGADLSLAPVLVDVAAEEEFRLPLLDEAADAYGARPIAVV